jgi:hypothetical protein
LSDISLTSAKIKRAIPSNYASITAFTALVVGFRATIIATKTSSFSWSLATRLARETPYRRPSSLLGHKENQRFPRHHALLSLLALIMWN